MNSKNFNVSCCHSLFFFITFFLFVQVAGGQVTPDTALSIAPEFLPEASADTFLLPAGYDVQLVERNSESALRFRKDGLADGLYRLNIQSEEAVLAFSSQTAYFPLETDAYGQLIILRSDGYAYNAFTLLHISLRSDQTPRTRVIPLWLSIMPPLMAIFLALVFREVIVSLFVGVWVGAFIAGGMRIESLYYFLLSFWEVVEKYIIQAMADSGHLSVIIFSLLIGGMVAIISRNGGMAGVVMHLSKYATNPRMAQFTTWLLGIAIFFDDYANTLIVGNTMRPVTDRFRISREKLAYLVDSTAAPIAAVAFITTWIGAELGYIESGISMLEGFDQSISPYAIFLSSLKYSFYPLLTLTFVFVLIAMKRDFGPMYRAEKRARKTGQVSREAAVSTKAKEMEDLNPVEGAPLRWQNAAFPVLTVILLTIYGLLETGFSSTAGQLSEAGMLGDHSDWGSVWASANNILSAESQSFFSKLGLIIGNSDSYSALLWASLSGVVLALVLSLSQRIMNLQDSMDTLFTGFKTMLPAVGILVLAWSLAITTQELRTADFLTSLLAGEVSPYAMPVITFVLAATIAFSTGSSWSTMAILYPIAIPTTWIMTQTAGMDPAIAMELLYNVIAVVLAASVLGDHCSPISDTTILSSLAADCNHIDHVRTQLPYALIVGAFALACNGLATMMGGSFLVCMLLAILSTGLLTLVIWKFGTKTELEDQSLEKY